MFIYHLNSVLQILTHRSDEFVRNGKLVVNPSNRFDCGQNVVSRSSREYSFSSVQYKSYNYNGHPTNENSMLVLKEHPTNENSMLVLKKNPTNENSMLVLKEHPTNEISVFMLKG